MQKFFLIFFVGALGFFISQYLNETPIITNDIMLENVEALADLENKPIKLPVECRMTGDVTCPNYGEKVDEVYEGYGLKADEETY